MSLAIATCTAAAVHLSTDLAVDVPGDYTRFTGKVALFNGLPAAAVANGSYLLFVRWTEAMAAEQPKTAAAVVDLAPRVLRQVVKAHPDAGRLLIWLGAWTDRPVLYQVDSDAGCAMERLPEGTTVSQPEPAALASTYHLAKDAWRQAGDGVDVPEAHWTIARHLCDAVRTGQYFDAAPTPVGCGLDTVEISPRGVTVHDRKGLPLVNCRLPEEAY